MDLVIRFFEIISLMVEHPEEKRVIDWRIRFFTKEVSSIEKGNPLTYDAHLMLQEIETCKRLRRSRRHRYNAAELDDVRNSYLISGRSQQTLIRAWDSFHFESYKILA